MVGRDSDNVCSMLDWLIERDDGLVERDVGSNDDVCPMLDWLVKRDVWNSENVCPCQLGW